MIAIANDRIFCNIRFGDGKLGDVMPGYDPEAAATRREWVVGIVAFLTASAAVIATAAYLFVQYVLPERKWFDALMFVLQCLPLMLAAALGATALAMRSVQRRHYRAGIYRCFRCRRALQGIGIPCVCLPPDMRKMPRPRRPMRHYRRQLKPVFLTYLAVLLPATIFTYFAPRARTTPADFLFLHALLCVLLGILLELALGVLEWFGRGKRFRPRIIVFRRVLVAWPLLMIAVGIVCAMLGFNLLTHNTP